MNLKSLETSVKARAMRAAIGIICTLFTASAMASLELAREKNCLACHAVDKPMLGPSYHDVAARYRGRTDAAVLLTRKVLQGGAGTWGSMPMPPNAITEAEAARLVTWLLALAPSAMPAPAVVSAPMRTVAAATVRRAANAQPKEVLLAQGRYLVDSVMGCGNCHATRLPDTTVVPGKELAGGRTYDTPLFKGTPGNLTSDTESGLGRWSTADIVRALTEGVRPNGVPLAPMMPVAFYKALTPEDALAVASYLQTVPPVKNPVEGSVYRQAWSVDSYADADKGFDAKEMAGNRLLRGGYLAALAHCLDCHTPIVNGASNYERDGGRGGRRFGVARVLAPNISPHTKSGIGGWSDAELRRALFEGVSRDGHPLQYPMPWSYLAGLTPDDKDSLVAWIRSLPPRD